MRCLASGVPLTYFLRTSYKDILVQHIDTSNVSLTFFFYATCAAFYLLPLWCLYGSTCSQAHSRTVYLLTMVNLIHVRSYPGSIFFAPS